ncbi:UDP-2,4-diacetamido-2,4,6-trideoxy-beta-L-altropyranose hydrolase [Alkaliphilus peptidifermentans]|uniref:UDP-2,4-diacetamido-2,4,6-trideoxy-beta-L-altropyranose hydrolase n=1 Tax=Alkaliphilus peptidifermentans DSM 18978 TaxID=1120976 RepID=A0A1G5JE53_9FIRM|nr:UDP-2,4-diacetamido-2,4,6-trideoxy-beta-L-altropyranose hydrolase [Alkaliphilus peptidifermentans]SCY86636.1 UDP-2,4-diacetamido-2,4,6-trideoxy-beta-L-altropyranose hydrolase [Alkaliphilus peptidifermentans DSM 18978]
MLVNNDVRVAIRADGNSRIGLGHITRTIALGDKLIQKNCKIIYITRDVREVLDILKDDNYKVVGIDSRLEISEEVNQINSIIDKEKIDIFIGDSFNIDGEYIKGLKQISKFVVILDNLRNMNIKADLIINGSIYADSLVEDLEKYNQRALLGTKYLILRDQFKNCKKRIVNKSVKNILITMGGADPLNLTPKIVRLINEIDKNLIVNVVLGSAFQNIEVLEELSEKIPQVSLHYNVNNMAELMSISDIAISAGGITLYELAAVGTPTIVITQAYNQILPTNVFSEKGIVKNLGDGNKLQDATFIEVFEELLSNYFKRKEMSQLGQRIIDGEGTNRCASEIIKIYSSLLK